jgi:hypothetical protein
LKKALLRISRNGGKFSGLNIPKRRKFFGVPFYQTRETRFFSFVSTHFFRRLCRKTASILCSQKHAGFSRPYLLNLDPLSLRRRRIRFIAFFRNFLNKLFLYLKNGVVFHPSRF